MMFGGNGIWQMVGEKYVRIGSMRAFFTEIDLTGLRSDYGS